MQTLAKIEVACFLIVTIFKMSHRRVFWSTLTVKILTIYLLCAFCFSPDFLFDWMLKDQHSCSGATYKQNIYIFHFELVCTFSIFPKYQNKIVVHHCSLVIYIVFSQAVCPLEGTVCRDKGTESAWPTLPLA